MILIFTLYLDPKGSDGTQVLSPTIQYNSILRGSKGILVDDSENYDTLDPTISNNIFFGQSSYSIDNQTTRRPSGPAELLGKYGSGLGCWPPEWGHKWYGEHH